MTTLIDKILEDKNYDYKELNASTLMVEYRYRIVNKHIFLNQLLKSYKFCGFKPLEFWLEKIDIIYDV